MSRNATVRARAMKVRSSVLGPVDLDESSLVTFPEGLYGFPAMREFALLPTPREGVWWLQSAEEPALAFLLADPFLYLPGHYHIDLSDVDLARLRTKDASDILVLAIVTMPTPPDESCTANLQAPVLFNLATRQAWQCIRVDDGFSVRESFDIHLLAGQPA